MYTLQVSTAAPWPVCTDTAILVDKIVKYFHTIGKLLLLLSCVSEGPSPRDPDLLQRLSSSPLIRRAPDGGRNQDSERGDNMFKVTQLIRAPLL